MKKWFFKKKSHAALDEKKTYPQLKQNLLDLVNEINHLAPEQADTLLAQLAFSLKSKASEEAPKQKFASTPEMMRWTAALVDRFWSGVDKTQLSKLYFSRQGGRPFIVAVDHLLPNDGKILDFGAGDGELAELLCERGLHVAAFEPSAERKQVLEERLKKYPNFLGIENEESGNTYDSVIMTEVIEHILDEQLNTCLKRIQQLVKIGGVLIVTTPNNENLDFGMSYCPLSNQLFHRWQHVRSFTQKTLVNLLKRYGFKEIVTHQLDFNSSLYVNHDRIWGTKEGKANLPPHIIKIRKNRPARSGHEQGLLFVGRRVR